jgi:hypothetical protein
MWAAGSQQTRAHQPDMHDQNSAGKPAAHPNRLHTRARAGRPYGRQTAPPSWAGTSGTPGRGTTGGKAPRRACMRPLEDETCQQSEGCKPCARHARLRSSSTWPALAHTRKPTGRTEHGLLISVKASALSCRAHGLQQPVYGSLRIGDAACMAAPALPSVWPNGPDVKPVVPALVSVRAQCSAQELFSVLFLEPDLQVR